MNTAEECAISSRNGPRRHERAFPPISPIELTLAITSTPQINSRGRAINPSRFLSRRHLLDLDLRHRRPRAPQIRLLRFRVLGVIIADRALDRVLGQHAAV